MHCKYRQYLRAIWYHVFSAAKGLQSSVCIMRHRVSMRFHFMVLRQIGDTLDFIFYL